MAKIKLEYIWLDGYFPTQNLRSKTKVEEHEDFKGTIVENGAFYIFKISKFLKKKNRLFGKIGCQLMPENRSLEIDKKEDLNLFKFYLKK